MLSEVRPQMHPRNLDAFLSDYSIDRARELSQIR